MKENNRFQFFLKCKWFLLSPILLFCLIFTGCGKSGSSGKGDFYIYCLDANDTKIAFEEYTPKGENTDELIHELVKCMEKEPKDIAMKKAIPDNVKLDEYSFSEQGDLSLYWSASYGNFTGVSEILRRAAIVKTLCQIPEINSIQFYVAGQPLTDSNMNAIGFMMADTFIDNTGETAYMQTASLSMYFSDSQGTGLSKIPVEITYDATIPMEQLAMEQLMKGPDSIEGASKKKLLKTVPEGTKINKIAVKENTCYLDLSSDFMEKRSDISDEVAIYSVVNTLVELPAINKVQFSIDGKQVLLFDDRVNFGEPFECNLDLITD